MADLKACIRYDHWANNESLRAITNAKNQNARALQIAGHILGISEMWLSRVEERSSILGPWPSLTPEAIQSVQEKLTNTWLKIVADSHDDRVVMYRNRSGQQVANRLDELVQELLLHGAHHRGQIALLLRLEGAEPPVSTDFIPALRAKLF